MSYCKYAEMVVEQACSLGAYTSKAYVLDFRAFTTEDENQQVETLSVAEDTGIALRVFIDNGQMGFSYMTGFAKQDMAILVRNALDNAGQTCFDPYRRQPKKFRQ